MKVKAGQMVYVPENARLYSGVTVLFTGTAKVLTVDEFDGTAMVKATEGWDKGMVQWVNLSDLQEVSAHDPDVVVSA